MKKLSTYLLAAAVLFAAGCENNIPDTGSVNNAPVSEVVLDEALAAGIEIQRGATYSVPEHISYLPIDATNTAQYYTSSDERIASITPEGILTGVSVGSCSITVRIGNEESDVMATFDVTVKEPDYIAIASLRFTNENPEYDIDGGTVDINNILYVGSADEVEYATETILFTSSDEKVATIDEDGIITIHKLGQTTITAAAEFSNVTPAVVTVKFYRMVEYSRFPGDGDGNGDGVNDGSPRAIMGSSATEWDAMPHSDGGWEMIEFDWLRGGHKDGWANTGQRNSYRYAMLDNRRIVSRSGDANNLPTATNGTAFCWQRPGGNKQSVESDGCYFIIDMKVSQPVNYFRTVNISDNADDRGIRVTRVSEIQGSNDNSHWATIATGIEGFNSRGDAEPYTYKMESEKAVFDNTVSYRYIKFIFNQKDRCYGYFVNPSDENSDRDGNAIQIAELYMGGKIYTE